MVVLAEGVLDFQMGLQRVTIVPPLINTAGVELMKRALKTKSAWRENTHTDKAHPKSAVGQASHSLVAVQASGTPLWTSAG